MLLILWNYLRGYVMIQVTGFSVERFLSMAAYRGLSLWGVASSGKGIICKVSRRDYPYLAHCAEKTGCSINQMGERGLPQFFVRYGGRRLLLGGVLFFLSALYVLSSFLWIVDVIGCERLSKEEVLAACEAQGLSPGVWKRHIDTKTVGEQLLLTFTDISWIAVTIDGTAAQIKIVETIPKVTMEDHVTPKDLVASSDGVIVSIATSAGTPLVVAGDVVTAGETLVSAQVLLMNGEEQVGQELVHAKAKITARVWYDLADSVPLVYTEKKYIESPKENHALILGNTMIDILRPKTDEAFTDWEVIYEKPFKIGDYAFPIAVRKELARPYTLEEKSRTEEDAKTLLTSMLEASLAEQLPDEAVAEDFQITFVREGHQMTAKARASALCRIEQEQDYASPIENTEERL